MITRYKKILFAISLFIGLNTLHAQYENDVWFFGGGSAGMSYSHTLKKFQPYSIHEPLGGEGCAVATDPTTGDMMFYTDGNTIYDRHHKVMPGGNNLGGNSSSAQAVAIVPVPGDCGQYYVFSNSKGGTPDVGKVYSSIVDMAANGGDGAVVNPKTLIRDNILEGMISIPKRNSNDFWLVGSDDNLGATFYVLEISVNGISSPKLYNLGPRAYTYCLSYNQKVGKIAASYPNNGVYVFDFDDSSGTLSNVKLIDDNFTSAYSSEWSLDGTKLYYSSWNNGADIRQYDFSNPTNPITVILDAYSSLDSLDGGGLKLGPDGKIYFIAARAATFLSCIISPDSAGLACQYQPNYIDLGTKIRSLNLSATLTPIWKPDDCQKPVWRARISSTNGYEEAPELLREVIQNGIAYVPPALSGKPYYWTHYNASLPQAVQVSGAATMECRLRNSKAKGGIDAYDVNLNLSDGNKSAFVNFMGAQWAIQDYSSIGFGAQELQNLPELLLDLEAWNTLRLEVHPGFLRVFVNGQFRLKFAYNGSLCRLSNFGISFKGSGELDWVKLFDGSGRQIYFEDFLSPCEFACIDAMPAQEAYINRYTAVEAFCGNRLTVSQPEFFKPGDRVLLIQMQGAVADVSEDTAVCGKVLFYGNAGNYEMNVVKKVVGNNIYLKYKTLRQYDVLGKVQLVYVPNLGDGVLDCVSCPPWDGNTGGVLVFTGNNINLEGDVDVSGKGFPGGIFFNEQTIEGNIEGLHYPADISPNLAGFKGTGIAITPTEKARGRAPQANAGGSGDAHNRGSGGGGNAVGGGNGGEYIGNSSNNNGEGIGSRPLRYDNGFNRVFPGGGGGGSHSNNGKGSRGGNGGGIIIALVRSIQYRGGAFRANGEHAPEHPSWPQNIDGGGGGGGGGAILIDASASIDPKILFEARGGAGTSVEYRHGHGGGGAGGVLWVSQWQGGQALLTGGSPGIGTDGKNNGATPGENGIVLTGLDIPVAQQIYPFLESMQFEVKPDCEGTATVFITPQGGKLPLHYFVDGAANWQTDSVFKGLSGGSHLFRIAESCDTVDSRVLVQTYNPLQAQAALIQARRCDSLGIIRIEATKGKEPYGYTQNSTPWTSGLMRDLEGGLYEIVVRDALGCSVSIPVWIEDLSETVSVKAGPSDTISLVKGKVAALSVAATSGSSPYVFVWSPPYGLSKDSIANPIASPLLTTTYMAQATDKWGCTGAASVTIKVIAPKVFIPNVFSPEGNMEENRSFGVVSADGVMEVVCFRVFDRWGTLMFERRNIQPGDISNAWDGTYRGQQAPSGIYLYTVKLKYLDGTEGVLSGDVLLVR